MEFSCGKCGANVSYVDGIITRTCDHSDSPVNAHMTATAYGEGGANTLVDSNIKQAFTKLFSALWDRNK